MRCVWLLFLTTVLSTAQSYLIETAAARLDAPGAVAIDPSGRVYFTDAHDTAIRRLERAAAPTTILASREDAPLRATDIAFDGAGNLYIAGGSVLSVLPPNGQLRTVAEGFTSLTGVAAEPSGSLVVVDDGRLRRVSAESTVSDVAVSSAGPVYDVAVAPRDRLVVVTASGVFLLNSDGTSERLPTEIAPLPETRAAVDAAGEVWLSGGGLWKIAGGKAWQMVAGSRGFSGDGGASISAEVNGPTGLAIDAGGNVYVADTLNNRVRVLWPPFAGAISAVSPTTRAAEVWPRGITLVWTRIQNAVTYEVFLGPAPDRLVSLGTTPDPLMTLRDLEPRTTYYWRVRTRLVPLPTIDSPVFSFTTTDVSNDPPPPPSDFQPAGSEAGLPTSFWMSWRGGGAQRYEIYVDENPFANARVGESAGTRFFVSGLKPSTQYYWRVIAVNGGYRIPSRIMQFVTAPRNGFGWLVNTIASAQVPGADGTVSTEAAVVAPRLVASDQSGNVLFLDNGRAVRRIAAADRRLSTFFVPSAGVVTGIAVDAQNNTYISLNEYILKYNRTGQRTILAGQPGRTGFADGGPQALFNGISSIAVNRRGELAVVDRNNNRVRMVSTSGNVRTLSDIESPSAVAFDSSENLYIVSGNRLLRNEQPIAADLPPVSAIAVDSNGAVYYIETATSTIRRFLPDGSAELVAGAPGSDGRAFGFGGDGQPATQAKFGFPDSLAFDAAGNLFIADTYNNRIRRIDLTGTVSTIAGIDTRAFPLFQPTDVAPAASGELFIADSGNNRISRISGRQFATTVANVDARNGVFVEITPRGELMFTDNRFAWVDRNATEAIHTATFSDAIAETLDSRVRMIGGIARNAAGETFVSDTLGNRILRIDAQGAISVVTQANAPGALSISPDDELYFAEAGRISRVLPTGSVVEVLAENASGLAHDRFGRLFFSAGRSVFVIEAGFVTRIAGRDSAPGTMTEGGPALNRRLGDARGLDVNRLTGEVFLADSGTNSVLRLIRNLPATLTVVTATPERITVKVAGRTGVGVSQFPVLVTGGGAAPRTITTGNDGTAGLNPANLAGTLVFSAPGLPPIEHQIVPPPTQ